MSDEVRTRLRVVFVCLCVCGGGASPDHDSRHCDPIHINALQYIYPIHILKKHSNTYKFSPRYMSKIYKDVVQYIYPHIYIGYMSWTYVLDRVSQGCICIGQHYMYWSACDPIHITCHPIYIMCSKIYVLDDTYILDNIAYVMENMCICIGRHVVQHIYTLPKIYTQYIYPTHMNESE